MICRPDVEGRRRLSQDIGFGGVRVAPLDTPLADLEAPSLGSGSSLALVEACRLLSVRRRARSLVAPAR